MMKKKVRKKDNIINFPSKLSSIEKEVEAIVFAAAEPLDVDTIKSNANLNKGSRKQKFRSLLLDKNFEPAKNLNLEDWQHCALRL